MHGPLLWLRGDSSFQWQIGPWRMVRPSVLQMNVKGGRQTVRQLVGQPREASIHAFNPLDITHLQPCAMARELRLLSLLVITAIKANPVTIQACFCFGLYLLKALRVSPFSLLHKRDIFLELVIICFMLSTRARENPSSSSEIQQREHSVLSFQCSNYI